MFSFSSKFAIGTVFIQKVDAPGMIKFDTYVGRRMDLHCTAVGKVILTFGPAETRGHMLAKQVFIRHTKNTITTPRLLASELKAVRKLGYALDDEEEELEVRCVAVPLIDDFGRFLAALSVTGTTRQIPTDSIERIAQILKQTAAAIVSQGAQPTFAGRTE